VRLKIQIDKRTYRVMVQSLVSVPEPLQGTFPVQAGSPAGSLQSPDDHSFGYPLGHRCNESGTRHRNEPLARARSVGLGRQDLVGGAAAARLQGGLKREEVCGLCAQGVVGAVKVVDEERERCRVHADEAALDLRLAANLDGRDQRDQQREQPHADHLAARP